MIFWVRVYAGVMLLASLATIGLAVLFALDGPLAPALGFGIASALPAALFGAVVVMPYKPWAWTLGLVAIALGMMGITIVVCVPLLLAWLKPNVKAAFCRL